MGRYVTKVNIEKCDLIIETTKYMVLVYSYFNFAVFLKVSYNVEKNYY